MNAWDELEQPLQMPTAPPQLEAESRLSVVELIENAPKWDPAYAIELVHLARNHLAVRALIAFPLEIARDYELRLRGEDKTKEIMRNQGAIRSLLKFYTIITDNLHSAENFQPKDQEDELES